MSDFVLCILMRTDLPTMGPGRACAMASHATNALMKVYGGKRGDLKSWCDETPQGFGTAIVLSVASLSDLQRLVGQCQAVPNKDVVTEIITDPDYRFTATSEVGNLLDQTKIKDYFYEGNNVVISMNMSTCAYVFGSKVILEPILKDLQLYPD